MDIGDDTHKSRTHETINKVKGNVAHWELVPHRHYRLVLSTVGRRLEKFKSTSEIVNAMYAALKGEVTIFLAVCLHNLTHVIAYKAACHAGVLHQDISPGNILIFGKDEKDPDNPHDSVIEGGILIDWDLSKLIDSNGKQSVACQYTCTVS
jgi:serine/threonine protein kinase